METLLNHDDYLNFLYVNFIIIIGTNESGLGASPSTFKNPSAGIHSGPLTGVMAHLDNSTFTSFSPEGVIDRLADSFRFQKLHE